MFIYYVFSAPHISRKHVKLIRTKIEGRVYWNILDEKSSMGTYLNGHRIPNNESLRK